MGGDRLREEGGYPRARAVKARLRLGVAGGPHFWIVATMLVVGGILHYAGLLFFYSEDSLFGLSEHAMARVLLVVPVAYGSFIYGSQGGFSILVVVTLLMLPQALLLSPNYLEALLETSGVILVSGLVILLFSGQQKERERRQEALAKLETARQELASHIEMITKSERQLAAIYEAYRVVTQSLELPQILQRILEKVVEVMKVEVALLFLKDNTSQKLELVAHKGVSQALVKAVAALKVGEGFNGRVAQTGESLVLENALEDPRLSIPEVRHEGLRSQLIVPLRSKGLTIGTLCVAVRSSRRFSKEDVDLLTAIGSQVGIAIENARLYQEVRNSEERYRELFESATVAIFVHDMEGVITAANKACASLTGYPLRELVGMKVSQLFPSHASAALPEREQELLRKGAIAEPYEVPMVKRDGAEAVISMTTGLISENGKLSGVQHIARDITERKRMRDTLNYYVRQVLSAQEEERKRIARELHDETAQSLLLISRRLDVLASDQGNNLSASVRGYLEEIRKVVVETLVNLRHLTQDLRPRILDDLGLEAAVEWLGDELRRQTGLQVEVKVKGPGQNLKPEAQLLLLRIAQEALSNIRKHAAASQVTVLLEYDPAKVRLTVEDNGKGFKVPANLADLAAQGKLGLLGMNERARLLNGTVSVHSEPGKGTVIEAELPV